MTANKALWELPTSGEVRHVTDLYSHLGVASIGKAGEIWRFDPATEESVLIAR